MAGPDPGIGSVSQYSKQKLTTACCDGRQAESGMHDICCATTHSAQPQHNHSTTTAQPQHCMFYKPHAVALIKQVVCRWQSHYLTLGDPWICACLTNYVDGVPLVKQVDGVGTVDHDSGIGSG